MVIVASLVAASVGIITGAVAWAWRNGTLGDTTQERYDHEFERITQRLHPSGAPNGQVNVPRHTE